MAQDFSKMMLVVVNGIIEVRKIALYGFHSGFKQNIPVPEMTADELIAYSVEGIPYIYNSEDLDSWRTLC